MIALFDGFALLRPLWLVVPLALLALGALVTARGVLGDWRRAIDAPLLDALKIRGQIDVPTTESRRPPAALVAAILVAVALAGPALERNTDDTFRNLDAVLIGMDVSRSMAAGGDPAEARLAALQVAEAAGTRQTGLLVYGGDAYMAATFTADRPALAELVATIRGDMIEEAGTAPARAVALAADRFHAAGITGGSLVLITDGGGIADDALAEAARLSGTGHRLDVVFLAPPGRPETAPAPDRASAARLAGAGGGRLVDADDPAAIERLVAASTAGRLGRSEFAVLAWADMGRWLAVLALLPLLTLFRRRS
ncbi:VWA domain-containing protein [Chthonobacter rhizosphaerae]|uniref:VWA domain-containing protein n=1 Tax=Chthonobacter rhizosphaerae TaxID=2735553 RepID=UPI0015EE3BD3|nr:VWA domain-containing protein [Chthonobacter rhizosphaerae]